MLARATVIKFTLIGLLLFGLGFLILNYISFKQRQWTPRTIDPSLIPFHPQSQLKTKLENVTPMKTSIRQYRISLKHNQSKDILVREVGTGKFHILLLPGLKFSSKIWEDMGTLQSLSKWGYRVFAVDLPKNISHNAQWLRKLIDVLQLKNLVIISPSITGPMTLQYIFQLRQKQKLIRGFVPIDPMGTDEYPIQKFRQLKIPTLIVHGEKDLRYQSALKKLQEIPRSELLIIKNASYRSLIEKPMEFHQRLRQFLSQLDRPIDLQRTKKIRSD